MSQRRSLGSLLIANLDPQLKERILNLKVDKHLLKKFDEEESKERVSQMIDLRDLNPKTETELYKTLNLMMSNKQYIHINLDSLYMQVLYLLILILVLIM